jgi:hypothetical protein
MRPPLRPPARYACIVRRIPIAQGNTGFSEKFVHFCNPPERLEIRLLEDRRKLVRALRSIAIMIVVRELEVAIG